MSGADVVRAFFAAFRTQDLDAATALMDDAFVFTSPQDDHIDRTAYLQRCFPTADRFVSQRVLQVVEDDGDGVFLLYEYELRSGEVFRNAEHLTVRAGLVTEVQVFFGGRY